MKKLLLVGGNNGNAHLKNYFNLIEDYFDEILVITNHVGDFTVAKKVNFQLKNPFLLKKSIREIESIISEFKPTIIHVHQANAYAFLTIKANKSKLPLVLTTWGSDVLLLPKQNFIYRKMVRYCLQKATKITADSSSMITEIENLSGRKDTFLLNFGIDLTFENIDIRQKENIIYSNRLHNPLYNIDRIVESCISFLEQNTSWKLIVAGTGSETERIKKISEKINPSQFEFVGFVNPSKNIEIYKKATIFVSIPSSDGTSVSLLEAMAFGCIPVVSDLESNKEWVENQINGIVVAKNKLSEGLIKAKELDLELVAKRNQEIIENRATKEVNKKGFIAIYKSIL
jgi:L-malate glycosyltransferase